jgi:hypothetical protein
VQKDADTLKADLHKALGNGFRVDAVRPAQELSPIGGTVLKSAGTSLNVFVRILRKDAAKRLVYGVCAQEERDKSNEIFDYASSKPYFQKWSAAAMERTTKADLPISYGNVRAQHGKIAAGKLVSIEFDDANKCIPVVAKIVDDNEWNKVQEGIYSGFSIGGSYVNKWADGSATRYTASPAEISLVDSPAMPSAVFSAVKNAGSDDDMVQREDGYWVRRRDLHKTDFAQTLAEIRRLVEIIQQAADAAPRSFRENGEASADAKALLDKSLAHPISNPHDGASSTFKPAHQTATPGVTVRSDGRNVFNGKVEDADLDAGVRKALGNPVRR